MTKLGIAIKLADRSFVLDNQGKRRPRLLIVIDGGRMRQVARVLPSWARLVIGPLFGLEEEEDNPR